LRRIGTNDTRARAVRRESIARELEARESIASVSERELFWCGDEEEVSREIPEKKTVGDPSGTQGFAAPPSED
jgi:hypothetical protein